MAERNNAKKKRKGETSETAEKPANGMKNNALIPADPQCGSKGEKKDGTQGKSTCETGASTRTAGSGALPVANGGHAVGPRSVPIRMTEEARRNLLSRIGVLLLIVAVLVAAVLIFLFRPTEYTERTHSVIFLYLPERDATVIVVDGEIEGEEDGYDGRLTYRADSGTGDVCAAIIGGSLYVVDGDDIEKFGDNVTDCVLSAEGDAVAWRNVERSLFYAETDAPEDYKCASELSPSERYCLSPDGQELLYVYQSADGISRLTVLSLSGNQPIFQADQNLTPVAVADACEYLYYLDEDGALYVLRGETGTVELCGRDPDELVFNADFSELLLRNGEESCMFIDGTLFGINDLGGTDRLEPVLNRRVSVLPVYRGTHCLTDSFLDQYYIHYSGSAKELVYLTEEDDRGQMLTVAYGVESVTVTDKYVYFLQTTSGTDPHTDLFYLETGETEYESCYGYVSSYCTNVDGSRLTYVNGTGLYSGKAGDLLEWLSDHVVRDRGVEVTCDDAFYYFKTAGELWVSDNGEEARLLADGVDWFFVDGNTLYYGTGFADDGVGTVWANHRNSRNSDKLMDGVGSIG